MAGWPHQRLGSRVLTVNKHVNKDIGDIDRCVHIAIPPSRISSTGSIYCATTAIRALEHAMNLSSNPGGWGSIARRVRNSLHRSRRCLRLVFLRGSVDLVQLMSASTALL